MRTLFAFGDSFTYGHGLEDCWIKQGDSYTVGPVCSQYAWPSILAKDLGYNLNNYSQPGFSNLAILHSILNTKFSNDAVCIIMWSYPLRDMIFKQSYINSTEMFDKNIDNSKNIVHMGSWVNSELTRNWLLTHNNVDLKIRSWLHIHHANLYLDSINIPHINFFIDFNSLKTHKPLFVKIPYGDIDLTLVDCALDNSHPGPLTHRRLGADIKECLFDKSII